MRLSAAALVAGLLVAGWVASACIRSWKGIQVDVVAEMIGAGTAAALIYAKMGGKPSGDGEGGAS
jgi:hypothetical protein